MLLIKIQLFQVISCSLKVVSGRSLLLVGRFLLLVGHFRSLQVVSCSLQVVPGRSLGRFLLVEGHSLLVVGHFRQFLARCRLFQVVLHFSKYLLFSSSELIRILSSSLTKFYCRLFFYILKLKQPYLAFPLSMCPCIQDIKIEPLSCF